MTYPGHAMPSETKFAMSLIPEMTRSGPDISRGNISEADLILRATMSPHGKPVYFQLVVRVDTPVNRFFVQERSAGDAGIS